MTTRQQLVDEFLEKYGLVMGDRADDSAHAYLSRGKVLIKQQGVLKIQAREGITHGDPHLDSVAGRAVVSGWWTWEDADETRRHWTTGEGDPKGKAVEGSHPVAMAEKRWRARGVLGLVLPPDLSALIYSKEEMPVDWDTPSDERKRPQEGRRERAPREPREERKPRRSREKPSRGKADADSITATFDKAVEQICELVDIPQDEMGQKLFQMFAAFETDSGDIIRPPRDSSFYDLASRPKPGWAKGTLQKAEAALEDLREGRTVVLREAKAKKEGDQWVTYWGPEIELSPVGSEEEQQPELDYDEVPF